MNKAEVITEWVAGIVGDDPVSNHPKIEDDYPPVLIGGIPTDGILSWEDITGQPAENLTPNPNMYTIRITCNDVTLALIEADANYYILSSEVIDEVT